MKLLVYIIVPFLCFLVTCNLQPSSENVYRQEIIGVYKPNFEAGVQEILELKGNGKYIYYYTSYDNIKSADSGTWRLIYRNNDSSNARVFFTDFVNRYPLLNGGYSNSNGARLDTISHSWNPFIYKKGKKIWIEKTHMVRQFYIKQ